MFRKKTPEEIAQLEADRVFEEELRKVEEYSRSPGGRARAAYYEGAELFQITLPVTEVVGSTIDPFLLYKGQQSKVKTNSNASDLDCIESEGWRLEHAGYVYMITKTESSAKVLTSGQREAVTGTLMGIYIFRRRD